MALVSALDYQEDDYEDWQDLNDSQQNKVQLARHFLMSVKIFSAGWSQDFVKVKSCIDDDTGVLLGRDLLRMYSEKCRRHLEYAEKGELQSEELTIEVPHSALLRLSEMFFDMPITFKSIDEVTGVVKAIAYLMLPPQLADRVAYMTMTESSDWNGDGLAVNQKKINNYIRLRETFELHSLSFPDKLRKHVASITESYLNSLESDTKSEDILSMPNDMWSDAIRRMAIESKLVTVTYQKLLPIIPHRLLGFMVPLLIVDGNTNFEELLVIMQDLQMKHPVAYKEVSAPFTDYALRRLLNPNRYINQWITLEWGQQRIQAVVKKYRLQLSTTPTALEFVVSEGVEYPVRLSLLVIKMPFETVIDLQSMSIQVVNGKKICRYTCPLPDYWQASGQRCMIMLI